MHNYLPRLCRSLPGFALRSTLLLGVVLVCSALALGQSAQPTLVGQYRWQIAGVLSFMIVETLLIGFLLISRSRQRRAEAERERFAHLAESEHRRLNEVVSNVPGMVWESRLDPNGTTRSEHFVSQHVEKMLGYSVEEWMSEPRFWLTIIPEEERERILGLSDEIFRSGRDGVVQYRWKTKDGRLLWVEAHLSVIFDENKVPIGLRGVTRSITNPAAKRGGLLIPRNIVEPRYSTGAPDGTSPKNTEKFCGPKFA